MNKNLVAVSFSLALIVGFASLAIDNFTLLSSFDDPSQLHGLQEAHPPQKRENQLNHALTQLSRIQEIHRFDRTILTDDGSVNNPALNFNGVDIHKALPFLVFYSEDRSERDSAFVKYVKFPLLCLLQDAAEASFKFPQTLKYLKEHRVTGRYQELLDVAIKDLFTDPIEGLTALSDATKGLIANKKLTSEEERKLRLFKNLGGFFYDQKAIQCLIATNDTVLGAHLDVTQLGGRISLLRVLQLQGEIFKLMMPSTFNLDPSMPSEGLLEGLRDKLSHLSRTKIEKIFSPSPESTAVFKGVLADVGRLNTCLKEINARYQKEAGSLSPTQQWAYIKSLTDKRIDPLQPPQWPGIDSLFSFLDPSLLLVNAVLPRQTYEVEIEELTPLPADRVMVEQYFQRRKSIYDILNRKGKALNNLKVFHKDLLDCGAAVEEPRAEAIFNQLKSTQEQLSQLFAARKNQDGEQKKLEINELMNQLLQELMETSPEQHLAQEEHREIVRAAQDKQRKLKELLDNIKPCNGSGNISEKYEEFCNKLREIGIVLLDSSFDWTKDPDTILEKTFHKVLRTGLISKQTKQALRRSRVQSLLELTSVIRDQLGVTTSLEFESVKETNKIIIEGKSGIINGCLHAFENKGDSATRDLWEIHGKLYGLGKEAQAITTQDELDQIHVRAGQYIQAFLSHYEAFLLKAPSSKLPTVTDLRQELLNKNRGDKTLQLRNFISKQQVQSDHRYHIPVLLEKKLKRQIKATPSNIPNFEFLLSAFYELLKEVNDYPELGGLRDTDQIRNYFFHIDPFDLEPLVVVSGRTIDSGVYINNSNGTIAKELAILVINVRYLLEDFLRKLI
jgi:hypothetical protein